MFLFIVLFWEKANSLEATRAEIKRDKKSFFKSGESFC